MSIIPCAHDPIGRREISKGLEGKRGDSRIRLFNVEAELARISSPAPPPPHGTRPRPHGAHEAHAIHVYPGPRARSFLSDGQSTSCKSIAMPSRITTVQRNNYTAESPTA